MKSFAEYLEEGVTAREREIVEAYRIAVREYANNPLLTVMPHDAMRATPPAKEPVSVELTVEQDKGFYAFGPYVDLSLEEFKEGDRVRVVKIEEVQQ